MTTVLITGSSGNVGKELIKALGEIKHNLTICAGVRSLHEDRGMLADYKIEYKKFDFTDIKSFKPALSVCDVLFLLRPPQISRVEKYFKPLIDTCKSATVRHIVFLSVQGVEKSKIIPHHKIEKLIVDSEIPYTFLRPAYFMQNFTTTLRNDLVNKRQIYLPAGNAKFTLIDVRDIGSVAASVVSNVSQHVNKSYELTCKEKLNFLQMAKKLSEHLGIQIQYRSPDLISFFFRKRKERIPIMLIGVMIMLHYFPRFQKEPDVTDWVERLTGKEAITFEQFVNDNKKLLVSQI